MHSGQESKELALPGSPFPRRRLLKGMGFPFDDLHYTLGTLTWYFLPQLRLTAGGILDVRLGQIVVPSTPL